MIILGDWFFIALALFIGVIGIWEILHVTNKQYSWLIVLIIYIFTLSFIFWVFFQSSEILPPIASYDSEHFLFSMQDIRISTMGVGFLIALLFTYSIASAKFDTHDVFYLFTMSLFLGISIQSVLFLRLSPQALASLEEYSYPNRYVTCLLIFYVYGGTALTEGWYWSENRYGGGSSGNCISVNLANVNKSITRVNVAIRDVFKDVRRADEMIEISYDLEFLDHIVSDKRGSYIGKAITEVRVDLSDPNGESLSLFKEKLNRNVDFLRRACDPAESGMQHYTAQEIFDVFQGVSGALCVYVAQIATMTANLAELEHQILHHRLRQKQK